MRILTTEEFDTRLTEALPMILAEVQHQIRMHEIEMHSARRAGPSARYVSDDDVAYELDRPESPP